MNLYVVGKPYVSDVIVSQSYVLFLNRSSRITSVINHQSKNDKSNDASLLSILKTTAAQ